jgi:predicted  nucleic acid-binding Zn-ribbon protein
MMSTDNKLQIYKMRVTSLIEEHADAMAQAQELHKQLQEANSKISKLEEQLRNINVQKEESTFTIDHDMVAANK